MYSLRRGVGTTIEIITKFSLNSIFNNLLIKYQNIKSIISIRPLLTTPLCLEISKRVSDIVRRLIRNRKSRSHHPTLHPGTPTLGGSS